MHIKRIHSYQRIHLLQQGYLLIEGVPAGQHAPGSATFP
jgi:hypothetical protein